MRAYVSISAHGFGHLAQVAPVVLALRRRLPDLEVIVRSGLPPEALKKALPDAHIEPCDHDFGIPMRGIYCSPADQILRVWQNQLAQADQIQDRIATRLRLKKIDFVVSGISPWPLSAAEGLGIPSFGIGSFSWSGILRRILTNESAVVEITRALDMAYSKASALFALTPGLGMDNLPTLAISHSIVRRGQPQRADILSIAKSDANAKIILLAFGGMTPIEMPDIAESADSCLLLSPTNWAAKGLGRATDSFPLPFENVIASADLVVSKAGYGIATELAALGTPSILIRREDWPEDQSIMEWLSRYSSCTAVTGMRDITTPLLQGKLRAVRKSTPPAEGGEELIADHIVGKMLGTCRKPPQ